MNKGGGGPQRGGGLKRDGAGWERGEEWCLCLSGLVAMLVNLQPAEKNCNFSKSVKRRVGEVGKSRGPRAT